MTELDHSEVPAIVNAYYQPEFTIDDIAVGEQEFCLELLNNLGFRCVSGAIGSLSATVKDLTREAIRDTVVIDSKDILPEKFFTGPNPYIDTGVGIWTAAHE